MRIIGMLLNVFIVCLTLIILVTVTPYLHSLTTNTPVYTNSAFDSYLEDFKNDAKNNNIKPNFFKLITVFSDNVDFGVAGYCIPNSKLVVISLRTWQYLTEEGRRVLLYHEWGHCVLEREHVDTMIFLSSCPISIMYPYVEPSTMCYNEMKDWYVKELFTNPLKYETFSGR